MLISTILSKIKDIIDNNATIASNYDGLIVTHKLQSSSSNVVITDYPYITIRAIADHEEESIGGFTSRDVNDDPVTGIFKNVVVSIFCWDDDETEAVDLAEYVKRALILGRHDNESDEMLDIKDFQVYESTPPRGPFGATRATCRCIVWANDVIIV